MTKVNISKKQEHLLAYLMLNMDRCGAIHTWPNLRDLKDLEDACLILPSWQHGVKITEAGSKYFADQDMPEQPEVKTYIVETNVHWFTLLEYPADPNTVNEDFAVCECMGVTIDDPVSILDYLRSSGAVDQPCNIIVREVAKP